MRYRLPVVQPARVEDSIRAARRHFLEPVAAPVPAPRPLAARHLETLVLWEEIRTVLGEAPTIAVLARRLGCAHVTALKRVQALQRKGYLPAGPGRRSKHQGIDARRRV